MESLKRRLVSSLARRPIMIPVLQELRDATLERRRRHRDRQQLRPFFLICVSRSGSSLLRTLLDSHPEISCAGEILHPKGIGGIRTWGRSRRRVLRHLRTSLEVLEQDACGAKLGFLHLGEHGLALEDVEAEFPERYLVLYRGDLVAQFLSLQLARATEDWHYKPERGRFAGQLRLEPDELERHAAEVTSLYEGLRSKPWLAPQSLWLRYEDLAADPQALFDERIAPFLGVDAAPVASKHEKQVIRPLADVIANYDEICDLESSRMRYVPSDPNAEHEG